MGRMEGGAREVGREQRKVEKGKGKRKGTHTFFGVEGYVCLHGVNCYWEKV